jgi:hypothetical protein
MTVFNMDALLAAIKPQNWPASVYVLLLTVLTYGLGLLFYRPSFPKKAPRIFEAYPILGAFRFFSKRSEFMSSAQALSRTGQYSFYFGKHQIVGLSGEDGRRTFFDSRDLDLANG